MYIKKKIKMLETLVLPVVLYECESSSVILKEKQAVWDIVLGRILVSTREVIRSRKKKITYWGAS